AGGCALAAADVLRGAGANLGRGLRGGERQRDREGPRAPSRDGRARDPPLRRAPAVSAAEGRASGETARATAEADEALALPAARGGDRGGPAAALVAAADLLQTEARPSRR